VFVSTFLIVTNKTRNGLDYDPAQDLADLPSDAFSSSNATSPQKESGDVIYMESRQSTTSFQPQRLVAPMTGLRQTTLWGREGAMPESQVNKKHNWPLVNQTEPPTHHKLVPEALATWVYPTNIGKIRDYQYNIVSRGLFHNLLVALPTGLGKTFIAATMILNFYRWTQDAQIIFVAPTKPLVAQQVEACFNIAGIPRSQTTMLTGEVQAGLRAEEWNNKRVFFMTPQTLINDLKQGACDPKRIVLIVIDEAHRATGGYAYVEVVKFIRRFNESFRVLALTATPGGTVEAVQKVIDGLDISRCEIRTEQSLDLREYVHTKDVRKEIFDPSEEMEMLFQLYAEAVGPVLGVVNGVNAYWVKDPLKLTTFGCNQAFAEWQKTAGRNANQGVKGMVFSVMKLLASIAHPLELLKYYSIRCFHDHMLNFRKETREGKSKSKYRQQIDKSQPFERMMVRLKAWTQDPEFVGHPKLEQVRAEVLNHFIDAGEGVDGKRTSTRVEIFSHYRDSVEEIVKVLSRDSPIVRPHVFVGQSAGKNSEGMSQKKQLEVTKKFKDGDYNVLISTSVGEEGLDIGEVDLIICYDSKSSPIRLLQRMGRTGRKRAGKVIWLQMKGKEQDDALKAMDGYEKMQGLIANPDTFTYHHDRSRRIVPKEIEPVVDKRVVDIPPENTQRTSSDFLPVPSKRGRAPKRPPKKFHMPDGVRTGFTTASRFGEDYDDEDEDDDEMRARANARRKSGPPLDEAEDIPPLEDILLTNAQSRELELQYQSAVGDDEDLLIAKPRLDRHPLRQRRLGSTKYVPHGRASKSLAEVLSRMSAIDEYSVQEQEALFRLSHLQPEDIGRTLVDTNDQDVVEVRDEQSVKRPRGRPPGKTAAARKPAASTKRKATKAPKQKAAPKQSRTLTSTALAMEADASSPPPSSPGMARATQGIDIGSSDTDFETDKEHDDYADDSDLADFVVNDADPIALVDSSLPSPSAAFKKSAKKPVEIVSSQLSVVDSSQDLPDVTDLFRPSGRTQKLTQTQKESSPAARVVRGKAPKNVARRRRIVGDDEDDE
jgi:ATP-dependent DNA helicase MPH1